MPNSGREYAGAVAVVALATLVRALMGPVLDVELPFITYFAAVFVTAWAWGFRPTLLAVALSGIAAVVLFFPPLGGGVRAALLPLIGLSVFAVTGIAAGMMGEGRRRALFVMRREAHEAREAHALAEDMASQAEEAAALAEEEAVRAEEQQAVAEEERVNAEAATAAALAAQATLEWQAGLLEQTHDAVLVWELGGPLVYWNRGAEVLYGWSRHDVLGKRSHELLRTAPADAASMREVEAELARRGEWAGELRHRTRDGRTLLVESRTVVLAGQQGRKLVLESNRDVTERMNTQEQLRQSQKMDAVGQLAGGIAHDFNNLLAAITGYASLLLTTLEPGDERRKDLEEIELAADRAAQLTYQLLAFSRKQMLQPASLDLNQVLRETARMLQRLLGETIELTVVPQAGLGGIVADRSQLEQVIVNLAVNARDAMPEGGQLTLETHDVELDESYVATHLDARPGPHVMLSVSDTGVGMSESIAARIFEPFFTTKERGKGTGLGLSTVYGIVRQSGGNIWVYSEPGRGTTFKIYFPRAAAAAPPADSAGESAGPAAARGAETILVVEDNDAVRGAAVRLLQAQGYRVLDAGSGREALELVERHANRIHLLLTDVVLPRMSGRQLADQLTARRPDVRVVYMSGYADDAIVRHGALEPGTAFIQKPFRADVLASRVREVLDA